METEENNNLSTGVQFEDYKPAYSFNTNTPSPKMIQWVMKISGGLIKNQNQANYILLGIAAIAFIISIFLILGEGNGRKTVDEAKMKKENAELERIINSTLYN